jgi:CRP/FNR family cyclic AMP-dependent transcriptional regulator
VAKRGAAVLERVPLFDGLTKRQLKHVQDLVEEVRYMEGASVVKEGAPGDSFFVIVEGQAKVQRGKRTINRLVPGDFFGEISLLDQGPRTASVVSETPMMMLEVQRTPFQRMLERNPEVVLRMMSRLASRLRRIERRSAG